MSDDQDEIRRKRLEKLQATERRASPSLSPSPSSVKLTPGRSSQASTSSSGNSGSNVGNNQAPKPKPKPAVTTSAPTPLSFEQWQNRAISDALRVSLEPGNDKCVYLEQLRAEFESDGVDPVLKSEYLDQIMFTRITEHPCLPAPFDYLWSSWQRAGSALRLLKSSDPDYDKKKDLLAEVQTLCVSYNNLVTTNPDMVENAPTTAQRVLAKATASPAPWDFLSATMTRAASEGEESIVAFVTPIVTHAAQDLTKVGGYCGDYKPHFALMEGLTTSKEGARAIALIDEFKIDENVGPADLPGQTVLGPFLSVSPLDGNGPIRNFPSPEIMNTMEARRLSGDIQTEHRVIMKRLFDLCNRIVRSGKPARNALLKYFGSVLDKNHKRKAMQINEGDVSPDGFVLNITYILTKLCEPFTDLYGTKINLVNFDYYRTEGCALDISEETKLNADLTQSKEYYDNKITDEPHFVSHCFFLTCAYHHYALGGVIDSVATLKRMINQLKEYLERLEFEFNRRAGSGMQDPRLQPTIDRAKMHLKKAMAKRISVQGCLYDFELQTTFMQFVMFQFLWLVHAADPQHQYPKETLFKLPFDSEPEYFKHYPEYMIESCAGYTVHLSRTFPQVLLGLNSQPMLTFCVTLLRNTKFVNNPYLKSKLIEILFFGSLDLGNQPGMLVNMFNSDPLCLEHLFHALMNFYIECEQTGASSQFYDKFNTRYYISQIIKCIWTNATYRNKLEQESREDVHFFVQFVALLLNDATYLLDESLTKLQEIHKLQRELPPPPRLGDPEEDQQTQEARGRLDSAENHCKSYMQLTNQTMALFGLFTSAVPQAFVTTEIVGRLGAMLNYNLEALVGPKCRELKVQNPENYGFNPRELLSSLCDVYMNLSKEREFVEAVARDGRSYKEENFTRAAKILSQHALKAPEKIDAFRSFARQVKEVKDEDEQGDVILGDIPDEFLDPLMFELMEDPVILPSSKTTVDRGTIATHLLSDPKDPFNRSPLKIEEVVPNTELKQKIEEFKAMRRAEYKQQQQQQQQQDSNEMDTST